MCIHHLSCFPVISHHKFWNPQSMFEFNVHVAYIWCDKQKIIFLYGSYLRILFLLQRGLPDNLPVQVSRHPRHHVSVTAAATAVTATAARLAKSQSKLAFSMFLLMSLSWHAMACHAISCHDMSCHDTIGQSNVKSSYRLWKHKFRRPKTEDLPRAQKSHVVLLNRPLSKTK